MSNYWLVRIYPNLLALLAVCNNSHVCILLQVIALFRALASDDGPSNGSLHDPSSSLRWKCGLSECSHKLLLIEPFFAYECNVHSVFSTSQSVSRLGIATRAKTFTLFLLKVVYLIHSAYPCRVHTPTPRARFRSTTRPSVRSITIEHRWACRRARLPLWTSTSPLEA